MKACVYFSTFLESLSSHARDIRHSIATQAAHRQHNSKLQRQNNTRWSSGLIMLVSFLKSYKKGVFTSEYRCPQSEKEIAAYIEILLPIYTLSNELQNKTSNISLVVPSILTIIYTLTKLRLCDNNQDEFRQSLISHIKLKFSHELSSNVYSAASVLNVESLRVWSVRSFGKEYCKHSLDSLIDVLTLFADPASSCQDVEVLDEPSADESPRDDACLSGCSFLHKLLRTTSVVQFSLTIFTCTNLNVIFFLS